MSARAALSLICVTACGAGSRPAPTGAVIASGLFAGLFAGDRTLVYDVNLTVEQDEPLTTETVTATITCHLTVGALGPYRTATIACDDVDETETRAEVDGWMHDMTLRLQGTYVTDNARLWRLTDLAPTTVAELAAALPAAPDLIQDQRPTTRRSVAEPYDSEFLIQPEGDGWCVEALHLGPHSRELTWCLSAASGITSVSASYDGRTSYWATASLRS